MLMLTQTLMFIERGPPTQCQDTVLVTQIVFEFFVFIP